MPPLRDRGEDVIWKSPKPPCRFASEEGKKFDGWMRRAQGLFRALPWPGNVRQLLNVIRNIVVLNDGGWVTLDMLPDTRPCRLTPAPWPGHRPRPVPEA
jgi:two-component system repressor protein LuxO